MSVTIWQQAWGFVNTLENYSPWHVDAGFAAGVKGFVPLLYDAGGDDATIQYNLAHAGTMRDYAKNKQEMGGWFNCRAGDAMTDARRVSWLITNYNLKFGVLDCEVEYKYPTGRPNGLTELIRALRSLRPYFMFGISSYGFADRAMIWRDLYPNQFRFLPQWYYLYDTKYSPEWSTRDLRDNQADPNIVHLPVSTMHGTLSCVEGHNLVEGHSRVRGAQSYGFTKGISYYTLENMVQGHFDLIAQQRGILFL